MAAAKKPTKSSSDQNKQVTSNKPSIYSGKIIPGRTVGAGSKPDRMGGVKTQAGKVVKGPLPGSSSAYASTKLNKPKKK